MVNEEDDEVEVNDEERYEEMLAKRQERRTVRFKIMVIFDLGRIIV